MRIVMVNGVFDILHRGHVEHLIQARCMGDRLIVALTDDLFVNKGPGRPINTWADRATVLDACRFVDRVYPTPNARHAILMHRPHIFCKGIDYARGDRFSEDVIAACLEVGAEIRYTTSPKQSATEIIKRSMEIV